MKKYFFLLLLVSSCFMFGQDVTKQMAMEIATHYYERVKNDNMSERINIIKAENRECYGRSPELMSPLGLADMWLVPVEDGWVLVSTNTKTTPVLAHYQTSQKPIYDSLSPGEKYLLEWYEKSIAYANDSCNDCERNWKWDSFLYERANDHAQMRAVEIVSPLLSTRWGQTRNNGYLPYDCDKCYNKFCPTIDNAPNQCDKAAVGCVAVAIGQIMAYWGWPYGAPVPTTSGGSTYDYQFYDWTLMPDWIYNSTSDNQVDMIAGFLRDCGYQASMSYGVSSGATDDSAKNALIAFGYDENTISLKAKWQTSGWQAMLFNELNAGRPVYYSGYSNFWGADGHAFVLDGYDSDGKFHINMGWRGTDDRYYQIDTIISHDGTNFNHWQSAIVGIQPAAYCDSFTIYSYTMIPTKFCLAISGELVLNGKVLENVVRNELYSATQVRLMPGTTIREGSNVHIAIKDVPCQSRTNGVSENSAMRVTQNKTFCNEQLNSTLFAISPNPVNSILHIQTSDELSQVNIYTLNGQCVLQTSQTDIDVSALPQGMYILRALNADGTSQQAKFIRE